jgi:hypothetical protein
MSAEHTYKFNVSMSCGGCSGAVNRVLGKLDGMSCFFCLVLFSHLSFPNLTTALSHRSKLYPPYSSHYAAISNGTMWDLR